MIVAAVPSSIGVFLGLVPASFGSCVVDRATNRSFEQIYGRLAHEREVGVVAAVAGQFNLVYRTNREFCDEMEVATIDLISAMFFIMVLDEKV